jgi:hypothetical protein
MPTYRTEAKALLEDRDRVAAELVPTTVRWNRLCASRAEPSEIRSLTTEIAALNERLRQIDTALLALEV